METRRRASLWGALLGLVLPAIAGPVDPASAASGRWADAELADADYAEARLIAAVDATGELDAVPAGLQVRLDAPWKTYWRSPGDAGLPPVIDWSRSENVANVELAFPAPERFELFGIDTFGYGDEVIFPLTVTVADPGRPVALRGDVNLLVCSDLCVPARFDLSLEIPAGAATADARRANIIDQFSSRVPGDGVAAGLRIEQVALVEAGDVLRVVGTARDPFAAPDIFIESDHHVVFGRPQATFSADGLRVVADLPVDWQTPAPEAGLAGEVLTVTLVDGVRAVEAVHVAMPGGAGDPSAASTAGRGLVVILGLALLGGLILNLMPCVLPVLSLKLLSVVNMGGAERATIRVGFLATAAGVVASFLALAGAMVAIKAAGGVVGWGIQFQQPLFLTFMVAILTLFACNLLGLFEIPLPGRLGDAAGRVGTGGGLSGHFATGVFATLLATPCSAPFLGTAVGFALSHGAGEIVLVFLALGLGMALPYLFVAAAPGLARALPRPGRWMVQLKRVLSLALIGTAVWLLTVVANQESMLAAGLVAGLMALAGIALWVRRSGAPVRRRMAGSAAAVLLLAGFALPAVFTPTEAASIEAEVVGWEAFDPGGIGRSVDAGRVVFLDITADWCLTCIANKTLVLDRAEVAAVLGGGEVVAMQADWTRPDDGIAAFLARHGRYGIPFNAVYGPQAPEGVILPELLTNDAVMNALRQAGWPG